MARARAGDERKRLVEWLFGLGEENVKRLAREAMASPRLAKSLKAAFERAATAKKRADQNVGALLSFLNLPTKQDHEDLRRGLEALKGAVTNLSIKVDRLLAEKEISPRKEAGASRAARRR